MTILDIGKRIKLLRTQCKMSQNELATKMGYTSRTTISKIESGNIKITTEDVVKFAEALHTSVPYLMGWNNIENQFPIVISSPNTKELQDAIISIDSCKPQFDNDTERSHRFSSYIKKMSKLTDDQQNIIYGMIDNMVPPKNNDVEPILLAAHEDDNSSETDKQSDIELLKKHIKYNKQ